MNTLDQKYCRFCAAQKSDDELLDVSIYTHVNVEIKLKLSLFKLGFDLDLSSNDYLPRTICYSCHTGLDNAHEFLLQLQRSQTLLNEVFSHGLTKSEVQVSSPVQVKAENPLKDEPESDISDDTDSESDYGLFSDHYIPETNVAIDGESEESGSEDEVITYMGIPIFEQDLSLKAIMRRSKNDKSWTSYKLRCQFCDEGCTDMYLLREHTKKAHDLCCAFKCSDCGDNFNNFETFVDHARGHKEELKNYCQYCNQKLKPSTAKKHISDHKIKDFICERCGKIFDTKYYLADHKTKYKPLKRKLNNIANPGKRKKRYRNPYMLPQGKVEKIEDKSWNGYPWTCQICETEFNDVTILRAHIREDHGQCFAMKCVDCKENIDTYRGFAYHVRRHRPFLRKHCHYCNYQFKENERDTDHISQHFIDSDRVCEGCGEIFPDLNSYQQHVATYDPPKPKKQPFRREKPVGIEDVTCDICHAVLKSQRCLRAHKLTHMERHKDFTCERCGRAFYKKNALQAHYVTHLEVAQEVCNICSKTFKSVTLLKKHILRHTEIRPFKCEICQKCFRQKNNLSEHLRVHTDETPFKCSYCEKRFRYKSNARTHEFQHTGARPYQCTDCDMVFTNAANRNKHMKRKHGHVPETNRVRTKFPPNMKVDNMDGNTVGNIPVC